MHHCDGDEPGLDNEDDGIAEAIDPCVSRPRWNAFKCPRRLLERSSSNSQESLSCSENEAKPQPNGLSLIVVGSVLEFPLSEGSKLKCHERGTEPRVDPLRHPREE